MREELDEYSEITGREINEIWSIKTMDSTLYKYVSIPSDKNVKNQYMIVEVFNDFNKDSIVYSS